MTDWGIPSLHLDRLATIIPTHVYAGGTVDDPAKTLFIWRTTRLSTARGMTVGFLRLGRTVRGPVAQS
jgi:hypothetical protein